MSTVISPHVVEQLNTPRTIYYSKPKLIVRTVIAACFAALFVWVAWKLLTLGKSDSDRILYWFGLVAGLAFCLLALIPAMPGWRAAGRPALSISKAGLEFAALPLVPWSQISDVSWHTSTAIGFVPIMSSLQLRGAEMPIPALGKANYWAIAAGGKCHGFDANCLDISSKQFLDYCSLYRSAGEQHLG